MVDIAKKERITYAVGPNSVVECFGKRVFLHFVLEKK
jgi:hypothetical protein